MAGSDAETIGLIALLRTSDRPSAQLASAVELAGSARHLLDQRGGTPRGPQLELFASRRPDLDAQLEAAASDLKRWRNRGITLSTILDPSYPAILRTAHDRPPLLFTLGAAEAPGRAIAIIGTRRPSPEGLRAAGDISRSLKPLNYMVFSGLARGVDAAVHRGALEAGVRTDAVLGTGLLRTYPPEHAALQEEITRQGLVISALWPETPPRPENFPRRNVLMAGLSRATLIIEAAPRSGTRIQARATLALGRPLLLHPLTQSQAWARELAELDNVHVVEAAEEAVAVVERLYREDPLTG